MLLQEQHIATFVQAAGIVLKNIVLTADVKQATASGKQMKLLTAATTSRDSDNEVQEVDERPAPVPNGDDEEVDKPVRQLLPPAPVPNGDDDDEVQEIHEPVRQLYHQHQ